MTNLIRLAAVIILSAALPSLASSQSLSVNTDGSAADGSAMLDVKSNTKGLLIPRMSRTERNAIATPATGLLIFQNAPDSIGYYYYNGTAWTWLLANSNADSLAWRTGGNTGTNPSTHFIGTRDNNDLVVKTNNVEVMRIATNGAIGLGTNIPSSGIGGGAKIDIRDETGAYSDISQLVAGIGGAGVHNFVKQRGTVAAPAAVDQADILGQIAALLYDGTTYRTGAIIRMQADGTISATRAPAALRFYTTDTNAVNPTERLTIKATGNVGIGVNAPVAKLDVTGSNSGTNSVLLRSGNVSNGFNSNQITFGYNGTATYRHSIKTRHNSVSKAGNAYDFYLWNQGVNAIDTLGSEPVMTIDGNWKGMVGIGTTIPRSELHITDGSPSLKAVNDAAGFGASILITDNNLPRIYFEAAGEAANKKMMDISQRGQSLVIASLNDAASSFDRPNILVANRDGNVGIGVAVPVVALDVAGSATIGTGNTNTGTRTIASGLGNNLSGNNSIVTGEGNTVTSIRSMVSGGANTVHGENNIVSGLFNNIITPYGHSIVVGYQDTLSGSASAIFGFLNKVTAFTGFAAGDRNSVLAQNGTAFGYQNAVLGTSGFVTGILDTAAGNTSAAFGIGNKAASFNEFALGLYGTNYTAVSTTGYDVTDRLFNIGRGTSPAARADAFTILKGGNVGIGTATPTALLDVNGNTIRLRTAKTPASSSDTGNTGDIAWDTDYIYICVATNTWKRVAIATW